MKAFKRAFIIVLDSFGIGREPDAPDFGDDVCNTLKTIAASPKYDTPNMKKIGLFNIDGVGCGTPVENCRLLCPPARTLAWQGHDDGALGNRRHCVRTSYADVSKRLPAGGHRRA